jgi:hypothetical protein
MVSELTADGEQGLKEILSHLKGEFGIRFERNYYSDFRDIRLVMESFPKGFLVASKRKTLRKLVFRKDARDMDHLRRSRFPPTLKGETSDF